MIKTNNRFFLIICILYIVAVLFSLANPTDGLDLSLLDCLSSEESYFYDFTPEYIPDDVCIPSSIQGLSVSEHLKLQKIKESEGHLTRILEGKYYRKSIIDKLNKYVCKGFMFYIVMSYDVLTIKYMRLYYLLYMHNKDGKKDDSSCRIMNFQTINFYFLRHGG